MANKNCIDQCSGGTREKPHEYKCKNTENKATVSPWFITSLNMLMCKCCDGNFTDFIAILTVTSPIVINVPTRGLLVVVTKVLLFRGWQNLNIKRVVCKQ